DQVSSRGNIEITVHEEADIDTVSVAASLAVGVGINGGGVAVSGAGAVATNVILTKANASIVDSQIGSANLAGVSDVIVEAKDESDIQAVIASAEEER
ncbi:hypothetical protein N8494_01595, partial [bacterium]|nr:hypothetical protein [bacterium]